MLLTKFPAVLLLLTTSSCRANITLAISKPDKLTSSLVEDLIYIVTSCYGDRIEAVALVGNLPDTLITTLSVRHSIPVVVINKDPSESLSWHMIPLKFRHNLKLFIVQASDHWAFDETLGYYVIPSMWWNHMASFIILDTSPDCRYYVHLLCVAWLRGLINAKVLCYSRGRRLIFNYNPFTKEAPIPWRLHGVFSLANMGREYPFTVFHRKVQRNKTICVDLDFEKRHNLGGYVIDVNGIEDKNIRTDSTRGNYQIAIEIERIFDAFREISNATVKFSGKESPESTMEEPITKIPSWLLYSWDLGITTYPYRQTGFGIISQFRGHKSQLHKILYVIDENSRYGMIIVYLISFMFFKFLVRQALVPAFLNLVRITCNTGFANLPGNTASRIYLGCLLFFAVTMQGIYQGNLASLLTTVIPLPDVNTLQDLDDFSYETCVDSATFVEQFGLKKVIVMHGYDAEACIEKVRNDPSVAYFGIAEGWQLDVTRKFKLHLSNKMIKPVYICFPIKWNWPLEERVNNIIQRMVEADVLKSWDVQCDPVKITDFEYDEAVKNNKDFKNIELSELAFAFVILGIGLTCASITLIIELLIQYKCVWRYRHGVSFVRR